MTNTMKTLATASFMTAGIFLAASAGAVAFDAASSSANAQSMHSGRGHSGYMLAQNNRQVRPMSPVVRSPVPGSGDRLIVDPPAVPRSPVPGYGPGPGFGGGPDFGGGWFGCASTRVHGSFHVRVCANGSYRVIGGGLFCSGRLSQSGGGFGLNIRLSRTTCDQGTDWSGGRFIAPKFPGRTAERHELLVYRHAGSALRRLAERTRLLPVAV